MLGRRRCGCGWCLELLLGRGSCCFGPLYPTRTRCWSSTANTQTWVSVNGHNCGCHTLLSEAVPLLGVLVPVWRASCRRGSDIMALDCFLVTFLTPAILNFSSFSFFLASFRFPSSSGAGGSVTLVRGGILGRENARGSAVLCPRALPGYLL